jgi:hypothetical protein
MEQSMHIVARWRRAAWQHRGICHIVTTPSPNKFRLGSEIVHNGRRYRVSHYEAAPDRRHFEVWGQPIDRWPATRTTLQLLPVYEQRHGS